MAKIYNGAFTCPSDKSAIAQMPQTDVYMAVDSPYKKLESRYRDNVQGLDAQIKSDTNALHKGYKPQKV